MQLWEFKIPNPEQTQPPSQVFQGLLDMTLRIYSTVPFKKNLKVFGDQLNSYESNNRTSNFINCLCDD